MTKEQIQCVKDGLSRQKLYIALGCIEELEKENEQLEKENEQLKQKIAKMKQDVEELKLGSEDVEMFLRTDELLRSWELAE